jgi:hypothetical protein
LSSTRWEEQIGYRIFSASDTSTGINGAFGASHRLQERPIHLSTQVSARWKNSCNAPAAARIGQAEIATMITKNGASTTNSNLFSLVK